MACYIKKFLSIIFCCIFVCTSVARAQSCANEQYRKSHPDKCEDVSPKKNNTLLIGTATAIGTGIGALGIISLVKSSNHSDSKSSTQSNRTPMPTLQTYSMVGNDVNSVHLASIVTNRKYALNVNQYNEIRLAYSLARGYTGKDTTIAILDAGANSPHTKKISNIISEQIAPDANIDSHKITDENGKFLSYEQIGRIIQDANNANVFNASWSVSMRANEILSKNHITSLTNETFIETIIDASTKQDAIFVWAAGNDYHTQSSALSAMPGVIPELNGHFINVVAWDTDTNSLAAFSNQCGITKNWCITAPGTNISTSAGNATGTSFATPIVSAAIAVLRQAFPYMSATQITDLLFTTARDLGTPGIDEVYGHGMLDLERATRPIGTALVALPDGMTRPLENTRMAGTIGYKLKSADINFAFLDDFGRAFTTNLNENISISNHGRGIERIREQNNKNSAKIGNIEFGIKSTSMFESHGVLDTSETQLINFVGTYNSLELNDIKFYNRTHLGFSAPQPAPDSMISNFSNIYTIDTTFGLEYKQWALSIRIPDAILSGNMYLDIPYARAHNGDILFTKKEINLSDTPAFEFNIKYKFLQTGFVDNRHGTDEFYIIANGHISF